MIDRKALKGNLLLLLTAAIWGSAFVAQRVGAQNMGSFTFNGIRFLLGALFLIPIMKHYHTKKTTAPLIPALKSSLVPGVILGAVLFIAASLQQVGMIYTTAGKAAFITGMYIIFVPLAGVFFKHPLTLKNIVSAVLALIGLYFLTVSEAMAINIGDVYQLIGAFFWTSHILLIDYFVRSHDALKLSVIQFLTTAVFSLLVGMIFEVTTLAMIQITLVPILYGGLLSVGVAYTLQIVAQKFAKPSHAAIILSLEAVFGVLAGVLLLSEVLTSRGLAGILLMFSGMMVSQMNVTLKKS
jgi:drug/metabolite transporter (DMT)-like permease